LKETKMKHRSAWNVIEVDADRKIMFIQDTCNVTGLMSITNDAEAVLESFRQTIGPEWRVVYQDTDSEWWEMVRVTTRTMWYIDFRPWHGVVWDELTSTRPKTSNVL
jgi:hypothetical protein